VILYASYNIDIDQTATTINVCVRNENNDQVSSTAVIGVEHLVMHRAAESDFMWLVKSVASLLMPGVEITEVRHYAGASVH
jgi:hypothetical protein